MVKQKNNSKGITLITLVISVLIVTILMTTIGYNALNRNNMDKLDDLYSDLTLLEEKYKSYYIKNGFVQLKNKYENLSDIENIGDARNPNDNDEYYYIGTNQADEGVNLKNTGTFVINEKTLTIYYLDGVKVEGKVYYALPKKYSQISTIENITNVSDGSWNETKKVNSPQLLEGMTPVYWDAEGTEHELINSNQTDWDKWYDYYANSWANAKTKDGSYWVWIPRYEYKITNPGTETASNIYIKFIKTSQTIPDLDYNYVHPAFTDGRANEFQNGEWSKEIPGFWVSKYVAGFQASTTDISGTLVNGEDEVKYSNKDYTSFNSNYTTNALGQNLTEANYATQKISYPVFKPLTYIYNIIGVGDCYTISRSIAQASEFYGLNDKTTDSHLSKNSEYGAVVYLAHSVFGRNGIEITANSKNVNNTINHIYGITGYSGTMPLPLNVLASSTNNMSGVFDLLGGAEEETAAYLANDNNNLKEYAKAFVQYNEQTEEYEKSSTKYCTVYKIGNTDTTEDNYSLYKDLNNSKNYGDALLEISYEGTNGQTTWFGYNSIFPNNNTPFFARNISYGSNNGSMFSFNGFSGIPSNTQSYRVILIAK